MKFNKKLLVLSPIIATSVCVPLVLSSCNYQQIKSIEIKGDTTIETLGSTKQVQYRALANETLDITNSCTWTSSAPTIATIDDTGLATIKQTGQVVFKAQYKNDTSKSSTISVNIIPFSANFIDDSKTIKNQEIKTQKENEIVYKFTTTDTTLSTQNLTALAKVANGSITIQPKVYVEVNNNVSPIEITAKVSYDASNVKLINDKTVFDITFTNTLSGHTWAQTINNLSITYTSPFGDINTQQQGYLFVGQAKEKKASRRFFFNYDPSATNITSTVTYQAGSHITLGSPTVSLSQETNVATVEIPYNTQDAVVGDYCYFSINLSCEINSSKYTQSYDISLMAVDNLYIVDQKTTITNGSELGWYYMWLGQPLGEDETVDDINVTITQSGSSTDPMYVELYKTQIDANKDYVSFIFNIKDSYIKPNTTTKFNLHIEKEDHRPSSTTGDPRPGGTSGWSQDFTDLELGYTGNYISNANTETQYHTVERSMFNYFTFTQNFTLSDPNDNLNNYDFSFTPVISSIPDGCEKKSFSDMFYITNTTISKNIIAIDYKLNQEWILGWPQTWKDYISASSERCLPIIYDCNVVITRKDIKTYQKQTFTIKNWLKLEYQ